MSIPILTTDDLEPGLAQDIGNLNQCLNLQVCIICPTIFSDFALNGIFLRRILLYTMYFFFQSKIVSKLKAVQHKEMTQNEANILIVWLKH